MMGTAIAAACVGHGLPVVLTDTAPEVIEAVAPRIVDELIASGRPSANAEALVRQFVCASGDSAPLTRCDLVLESIVETLPAKHEVYRQVQPQLGPTTILASNTSTIPVARLAAGVAAPERFCGIHFFHPVRQRPLVEVIRGPQSSDETIATAVGFAKTLEKTPIVVSDGPGFLVNRLLVPYLNEALELLLEGATVDQVEQAALKFGMAKGPLRLMDEIGLDTTFLGGRVLWEAFPDRVIASPLLVSMVKYGLLGCKSGRGFFEYPQARPQVTPRRTFDDLLASWSRPSRPMAEEILTARLFLPMVLEATRMLEEGAVRDPRDIDLAVLFGLGFPSARGGLLYWADTVGAAQLLEQLRPLESLGAHMIPTQLLAEMTGAGGRFYESSG
jgi:3-hydroxyacyl-CoA dehydrogenase/enoyl-CoA hydratase/3-hydroxybutyryl-CoA epimerase/3-hydroxyacyl-CoA dehydrogenase/enoyl-CoA hydratase/3-hydroxybutyryl-CoA epimerase/enoyl-CoA isomerase